MSWPSDGEPRYVVRPCTGYAVGEAPPAGGTRPPTSWAVLDRAFSHRVVFESVQGARLPYRVATLLEDPLLAEETWHYLTMLRGDKLHNRRAYWHLRRLHRAALPI